MSEYVRSDVMIAFAVMTAVTVASRLGGYWLMGYVTVTPRVRRMLDALPGSIIVAAALPVAVNGGAVVMVAIVAALLVTVIRRNDFLAVITGMRDRVCRVARPGPTPALAPDHARSSRPDENDLSFSCGEEACQQA